MTISHTVRPLEEVVEEPEARLPWANRAGNEGLRMLKRSHSLPELNIGNEEGWPIEESCSKTGPHLLMCGDTPKHITLMERICIAQVGTLMSKT